MIHYVQNMNYFFRNYREILQKGMNKLKCLKQIKYIDYYFYIGVYFALNYTINWNFKAMFPLLSVNNYDKYTYYVSHTYNIMLCS